MELPEECSDSDTECCTDFQLVSSCNEGLSGTDINCIGHLSCVSILDDPVMIDAEGDIDCDGWGGCSYGGMMMIAAGDIHCDGSFGYLISCKILKMFPKNCLNFWNVELLTKSLKNATCAVISGATIKCTMEGIRRIHLYPQQWWRAAIYIVTAPFRATSIQHHNTTHLRFIVLEPFHVSMA